MAWGVRNVFLRLKKRYHVDGNKNMLEKVEAEKNLGIEEISVITCSTGVGKGTHKAF